MIRSLLILLEKEFRLMRRNKLIIRTLIVYPLSISLLVPLATTLDVHNLGAAVVDSDHSALSHRLIRDMDASEYIRLQMLAASYEEALRSLDHGEVDVVIEIPSGMESDMVTATGDKRIRIAGNAVNAIKGTLGSQYVVQSMTSTLRSLFPRADGMSISVQNLYNPTLDYRHFMIPALFIIMAIMICGFLPAISVVTEKEEGTIEQVNVTPVSRTAFMLSKLIPYWIIGVIEFAICMLTVWPVYGLAPSGSLALIFLAIILFVLMISALGVVVANICESSLQTMLIMYTVNTLFVLMGGMTTPIECMPHWAQNITWFIPARYFIDILRSVYLKSSVFVDLWPDYLLLLLFALALNILATLTYRKKTV